MCIRDRHCRDILVSVLQHQYPDCAFGRWAEENAERGGRSCLLYTSDAADDLLCVDLGGRRLLNKKKQQQQQQQQQPY